MIEESGAITPNGQTYIAEANTEIYFTLTDRQTLSFTLQNQDGSPAVGIIDVSHRSPTVKGNGDALITWQETLRWGPSVNSSDDSWVKMVTLVNHSKSSQEIVFRYYKIG